MYIQSYQIHNVLNEYRKRLSQSPETKANQRSAKEGVKDNVQLSHDAQRQAIIDQVSANIVEKITQYGPKSTFNDVLENQMLNTANREPEKKDQSESEFIYTAIDENNQKLTRTFPINNSESSIRASVEASVRASVKAPENTETAYISQNEPSGSS